MAITATERTQIIELTALMFNAAPGTVYLSTMVSIFEANGHNLQSLATTLAGTAAYVSLNPNFQTAAEFASKLLKPIGLQGDAFATDFVVSRFNAGQSKASIAFAAFTALNAVADGAPAQYVAARDALLNKAEVAEYFSVTKEGAATDLPTLQAVIASVNSAAASVAAAEAAIDNPALGQSGSNFVLTLSQDVLTGTAGNDQFFARVTAAADGITFVDALQNFDQLDGGVGNDTLNATLSANAAVTPTLAAIENVILRSTAAGFATLDLSASSGIQNVTVANSSGQAEVLSVGAIANLGVSHQNQIVFFNEVTAAALNLSFDNVGRVSATAPLQVAVDLGEFVASKSTTLNITTVNSNVHVQDFSGGSVATKATIAATGANQVKFENGATTLASLAITGAGTVDLSDISLVALDTLTVADGAVKFKNDGSTAATFSATTGAGKDSLTVEGANVQNVSTGAGDDTVVTVNTGLAATSVVDLAAGTDALTLNAAPVEGVTLTGGVGTDTLTMESATFGAISTFSFENLAKLTGFEPLSISDPLSVDIDLSLIAGLTSFQTVGVAAAGTQTVFNVGDNFPVIMKGALATNTGTLVVQLENASGSSDLLDLTLNTTITQNADATVDTTAATVNVVADGVEFLSVTSTARRTPSRSPPARRWTWRPTRWL